MAFISDYQPENYSVVFDCPDGDNEVMVAGARIAQAKASGAQMLEIAFKVKGCPGFYYERYVEGEYFNRNITKFFDALGINRGDFNFDGWKGKRGVAHFEHEVQEYINGYGEQKSINKAIMKYLIVPAQDSAATVPNPATTQPAPRRSAPKFEPAQAPVPGMTTAANTVKKPAPRPTSPADDDADFPEDIPF